MNAKTSESFDIFWAAYPRKVGKGDARRVWSRLRPSEAFLSEIILALDWQKRSPQWTKDGGQFIPHPATWLRQERWTDEPVKLLQAARDARTMGRGAEACDAFDRAGEALERLYERRSGQATPAKRLEAPSRPPTSKA